MHALASPGTTTRLTRGRFLALAGAGAAWLAAPEAGRAALRRPAASNPVRSFVSRSDLRPPAIAVTTDTAAATPGYVFLAPASGPSQLGALIVDSTGEPVWFQPAAGKSLHDFRVQELNGEPVLTWWEGTFQDGYGEGEYVILDSGYNEIRRVAAANGYAADLHEFTITPQGTALISAYDAVTADLSARGGPKDGTLLDGVVQEIDLGTGELVFEWHARDHIDIWESYIAVTSPWDFFHLNSVDRLADGNLLISARHTSAVYKVDRATGAILWRLNGTRSDFAMGPGTTFNFQHDARGHDGGVVSIFDDGGYAVETATEPASRAIYLALDEQAMKATLERAYVQPQGKLAIAMGNVQLLANGNSFVGWGWVPSYSEFDGGGELLYDAAAIGGGVSYRTYLGDWQGAAPGAPALALVRAGDGVDLHVSWNGATQVAEWRVSGGPTRQRARPIHTVRRTGFETRIHVPRPPALVRVEALDATGKVLGSTAVTRVPA